MRAEYAPFGQAGKARRESTHQGRGAALGGELRQAAGAARGLTLARECALAKKDRIGESAGVGLSMGGNHDGPSQVPKLRCPISGRKSRSRAGDN